MSAANRSIPAEAQTDNSYQTRSAALADLPQLVEVLTTSFYPPSLLNHWFYWVMKLGLHEDLKRRIQSSNQRYRCLVTVKCGQARPAATANHHIAGTIEVSLRPCQAWRLFPPHRVYLSNLAVRTDCRRTGVAQQLLATCELVAAEWGCHELYLHVTENNEKARNLYQKAGYQLCEVGNPIIAALGLQPRQLLLSKRLSS